MPMRPPVAALALLLALSPALSLAPGLAARTAAAQPLPNTHSVTGVAADDVLNIRAQPDARAPILGTLPPFAIGVEVIALSEDGRWGMVGLPEGNGWVNLRFLAPDPPPPAGALPRPMVCLGTEPFWSLTFGIRGTDYIDPELARPEPLEVLDEAGDRQGWYAHLKQAARGEHRIIIRPEMCSDGMSDRLYGYAALRFFAGPDGVQVERGCCTRDRR